MQIIKSKLSYTLNFLKIFGVYLEKYELKATKVEKFIEYWSIVALFFHVILISVSSFIVCYSLIFGSLCISKNFVIIINLIVHISSGIIFVIFTIYYREKVRHLWKLIDQLDDYILRFLKLDINYKHENLLSLGSIVALISIIFMFSIAISQSNFTATANYHKVFKIRFYFIILNHLNSHKCIFFLAILCNRLKIIAEKFDEIRQNDDKLVALMQVYSIMWQMSRKIEKYFYPLMIMHLICFYANFCFAAQIIAIDIEKNFLNATHLIPLFGPQILLGYYCICGEKLEKIVSTGLVIYNKNKN